MTSGSPRRNLGEKPYFGTKRLPHKALNRHSMLYWRVDIEIFAASIGRDDAYDLDNLDARGDCWSLTHSALANGVAALKSLLRGDAERARESLGNAYARIDQPIPDGSPLDQICGLAEIVGRPDLEKAELVRRLQPHSEAARAALENEFSSRC